VAAIEGRQAFEDLKIRRIERQETDLPAVAWAG
jgi:hypothetical protein